jgi:hypothetical protein
VVTSHHLAPETQVTVTAPILCPLFCVLAIPSYFLCLEWHFCLYFHPDDIQFTWEVFSLNINSQKEKNINFTWVFVHFDSSAFAIESRDHNTIYKMYKKKNRM